MTTDSPEAAAQTVESFSDPESLREREDVPFHEERDVVDEETIDVLQDLDDLAPVGVTNDDGEILVTRITETCAWKIPSSAVSPDEDFPTATREWVQQNTGLSISLDGIEGVWHFDLRTEDEERTASRYFVVFSATPLGDESLDARPADGAEEAGWFEELPEGAERVPGTDLFLD